MQEAQTGTYRVRMSVEPAVILSRPKTFKGDWYEFLFENMEHAKMKVAKGLRITATLSSMPDIETAGSRARGLVDRFLSLLSYLTVTSLPEILIHKVYDVTPGRTRGRFLQKYYGVQLDTMSVRPINDSDLVEATKRLSGLSEDDNNSLFRAMHWYRLALQSGDVLERFALLWIGLESINCLLRGHYGLEIEYSHCQECGHRGVPTLNGVRKLWSDAKTEVSWKRVLGQRAGTLHGFDALKDIVPEAKFMVPLLERVLREGLDMLLGVTSRTDTSPLDLGAARPAYYSSEAIVEGPDLQYLDSTIIPQFEIDLKTLDPMPDRQGQKFNATPIIDKRFCFVDVKHKYHPSPQTGWRVEVETFGEHQGPPK